MGITMSKLISKLWFREFCYLFVCTVNFVLVCNTMAALPIRFANMAVVGFGVALMFADWCRSK